MPALKPPTDDDARGRRGSGARRLLAGRGGLFRLAVPAIAVCIAVITLTNSQRAPEYTISDTSLTITAASGESIPLADITGAELKDTMPPNLVKIVGDRVGTQLRGDFESNGTAMKIYVNTSTPPFVYLNATSGPVILNEQSAAKTRTLYDELRHKIESAGSRD